MSESKPPLEYLLRCSEPSLEGIELSELNHAANLRRKSSELLARILDQWVEAEVQARLARLIRDARQESPARHRAAPRLGGTNERTGS
jgi:hypothetical protein